MEQLVNAIWERDSARLSGIQNVPEVPDLPYIFARHANSSLLTSKEAAAAISAEIPALNCRNLADFVALYRKQRMTGLEKIVNDILKGA
jgi:hypothetical protein